MTLAGVDGPALESSAAWTSDALVVLASTGGAIALLAIAIALCSRSGFQLSLKLGNEYHPVATAAAYTLEPAPDDVALAEPTMTAPLPSCLTISDQPEPCEPLPALPAFLTEVHQRHGEGENEESNEESSLVSISLQRSVAERVVKQRVDKLESKRYYPSSNVKRGAKRYLGDLLRRRAGEQARARQPSTRPAAHSHGGCGGGVNAGNVSTRQPGRLGQGPREAALAAETLAAITEGHIYRGALAAATLAAITEAPVAGASLPDDDQLSATWLKTGIC